MDVVSLYIAGKILHLRPGALRLCIGGTIGGLYGVISLFLTATPLLSFFLTVAVCAVISFIVLDGKSLFSLLLSMLCFFVSGASVSGIMTAVITVLGDTIVSEGPAEPDLSGTVFMVVSGIAVLFAFAFGRIFSITGKEKTTELTVISGDKSVTVTGISDSGNTAAEPISGSPVIIVKTEDVKDVLPDDLLEAFLGGAFDLEGLTMPTLRRTRLVPVSTVTGKGLLLSYRPDKIEVKIKGKRKTVDGVIALDENLQCGPGGVSAILPASILV